MKFNLALVFVARLAAPFLAGGAVACSGPSFSVANDSALQTETVEPTSNASEPGPPVQEPHISPNEPPSGAAGSGGAATQLPTLAGDAGALVSIADAGITDKVVDAALSESVVDAALPAPPLTDAELLVQHIEEIGNSTGALLDSLSEKNRAAVLHSFQDDARTDLNHTPGVRSGASLQGFTSAQMAQLNALLRLVLSDRGFTQVWEVLTLEGDPQDAKELPYYFAVFGEPQSSLWSLRLEGHHLSLNLTFKNGAQVSATPMFLGADPAVVVGTAGGEYRTLGSEDELGLQIIDSLSAELRREAWVSQQTVPELETGDVTRVQPFSVVGAAVAAFPAASKGLVRALVAAHIEDLHPRIAAVQMGELDAAGYDGFNFLWRGPRSISANHYFRLQGSDLLIEVLMKDKASHMHTVWRAFEGDYGRAL